MSRRNLERLRVLIVDDNHHMINIVKTILRGFGIKDYYEARDAVEAFDMVRSESIDMVIVDYQMEILDGTVIAVHGSLAACMAMLGLELAR